MNEFQEGKTCLEEAKEMEDILETLSAAFLRDKLWKARNCLVKLYEQKEKTKYKNLSLGVFREIIKYA